MMASEAGALALRMALVVVALVVVALVVVAYGAEWAGRLVRRWFR